MKKYILSVFILLATTVSGQTLDDLFRSIPPSILPGITEDNKTMLIVDTAAASVPYIFGEITKLSHTESYIKLQTSDIGTTQIKLLPIAGDSVIISVVNTVCGGVKSAICNSDISFYTTEWEKLNNNLYLPEISAESFFDSSKKSTDNYKYALSLPDMSPISAEYNGTGNTLTLIFNYKKHLSDNHIETIKPFLISDTLALSWQDNSFR